MNAKDKFIIALRWEDSFSRKNRFQGGWKKNQFLPMASRAPLNIKLGVRPFSEPGRQGVEAPSYKKNYFPGKKRFPFPVKLFMI